MGSPSAYRQRRLAVNHGLNPRIRPNAAVIFPAASKQSAVPDCGVVTDARNSDGEKCTRTNRPERLSNGDPASEGYGNRLVHERLGLCEYPFGNMEGS